MNRDSRLRVIYDISVLGMGEVDERARTGVHRVIENLLAGFQRSPELEIIPFSRKQFSDHTLAYMARNQDFFPVSRSRQQGRETLKSILVGLFTGKHDVALLTEETLTGNIKSSDIFHATYFPLPHEVRGVDRIKKFLTVYDLIPVKFPEYFTEAHISTFRETIESITVDTIVFAISHSTKNDLCEYHRSINPDNVFVTHPAASDSFYPVTNDEKKKAVKEKYGIMTGKYVLSLATLEPRKNIETTIKAFAQLIREEKMVDLSLVLVGPKGWKFNHILDSITNEKDLQKKVIFTGYADDEDLAPLYSEALVFVYPSLYEGFGLPLLEAMQCGLPVITSNTSSLPEVVGDAGILIEPSDSDSICGHIRDFYCDERKREIMSQKSLSRAKNFSWSKCVRETIDIFQNSV